MRKTLLIPFLLLAILKTFGQSLYTSEKIYLHTDRDKYVAGDTIWFSATLFDASSHLLSEASNTVYVSLLNENKQPTLEQKLFCNLGQTSGSLVLSTNLSTGAYGLVAYTNLMRNHDESFFFQKQIQVFAQNFIKIPNIVVQDNNFQVQFFPEGGNLVNGLVSKVAFKAMDINGKGIEIDAVLEDENHETLNEFKSAYLGMGQFSFTPQTGHQYSVRASYNGQLRQFKLPNVLPEGLVITVDNVNFKRGIRTQIMNNKTTKLPLKLVAHLRGQIISETKLDSSKTISIIEIPQYAVMNSGIVHLTLFEANLPVCERLVFINQKRELRFEVKTDKSTYKPREEINAEISVVDASNRPVVGSFSLAVTDALQVTQADDVPYLPAYLLINSDLKGGIENPNAYFEMDESKSKLYLDYLMMTQGWRRFVWKELATKPMPYQAEKALILSGKAYKNENKLLANETIKLAVWDKLGMHISAIKTDEKGGFSVPNTWVDSVKIIATDKKDRDVFLDLDSNSPNFQGITFSKNVVYNNASAKQLVENSLLMPKMSNEGIDLKEVFVQGKATDIIQDDTRQVLYFGKPSRVVKITPAMRGSAASIYDLIEGQVSGVYVTGVNPYKSANVPILVDGGRPSDLGGIEPQTVAQIDVINDISIIPLGGSPAQSIVANKILNILTKRGSKIDVVTFASKNKTPWLGYTLRREFYSPVYNFQSPIVVSDYRPTLYWNANIKTDKDGKAKVTFYNSDIAKRFRISIEGTDGNGNVGVLNVVVK